MSHAPDDVRLSKFFALVLRHTPERFGLAPDEEGFVPLDELVLVVRGQRGWSDLGPEDVRRVVASSDKSRYEIAGDRVRARYGHSIPGRIAYPPAVPPETLFHGTAPEALPLIRREGLRGMRRQYVHCSIQPDLAATVGRRHAEEPVILTVRAREAHAAGVLFYNPEPRIFLADAIPPAFLDEPSL